MDAAAEEIAKDVEMRAMLKMGQYQPGWAELADSTKHRRVSEGWTENEPLLESNRLRESIQHTRVSYRDRVDVFIGSNLVYARRQELGFGPTPPRPYLAPALVETMPDVGKRVEQLVKDLFTADWT
jgi:hypothetical protein